MHASGTPVTSSTTSYVFSLRSSPEESDSSAPSSTLTTKETATLAPPGQRGSGGRSPYPRKSRALTLISILHGQGGRVERAPSPSPSPPQGARGSTCPLPTVARRSK